MKNSRLAIWSLVLGILGVMLVLACVGPLFAIPAILCGHVAYGRIRRSAGALSGEGLALAGLITGYVGLAIGIVLVPFVAAIAIPNFVKARDTAQKNACINNLQKIDLAKQQWALEHNKTAGDIPTPQDLEPYINGGFASLHCPADGIYTINSMLAAPACSISNHVLDYYRPFVPPTPRRGGPQQTFTPPPRPATPNDPFAPPPRTNFSMVRSNSLMNRMQMREAANRDRCVVNLRIIQSAKRIWAAKNHKGSNDVPTLYELTPYLPGQRLPVCPSGGMYRFGTVEENPGCSVPGHRLPTAP